MKRATTIGLAMFWLGGCTQYQWTHPNWSEATWNKDSYECERDMRQSAYFGGGLVGQANAQQFQERCLRARGYVKEAMK